MRSDCFTSSYFSSCIHSLLLEGKVQYYQNLARSLG